MKALELFNWFLKSASREMLLAHRLTEGGQPLIRDCDYRVRKPLAAVIVSYCYATY